jgi:hypothetical protein
MVHFGSLIDRPAFAGMCLQALGTAGVNFLLALEEIL